MAKHSLDDSASAENLSCYRTFASNPLAEGAALLRAAPDDALLSYHSSLDHAHLWEGAAALSFANARLSWEGKPTAAEERRAKRK